MRETQVPMEGMRVANEAAKLDKTAKSHDAAKVSGAANEAIQLSDFLHESNT
jgi:hypothetical protein